MKHHPSLWVFDLEEARGLPVGERNLEQLEYAYSKHSRCMSNIQGAYIPNYAEEVLSRASMAAICSDISAFFDIRSVI